MILPPWSSSRNFAAAAWMPHITPPTLILWISSRSSDRTSSMGLTWAMPALLTTMCMWLLACGATRGSA
jgi:hypothetical protein